MKALISAVALFALIASARAEDESKRWKERFHDHLLSSAVMLYGASEADLWRFYYPLQAVIEDLEFLVSLEPKSKYSEKSDAVNVVMEIYTNIIFRAGIALDLKLDRIRENSPNNGFYALCLQVKKDAKRYADYCEKRRNEVYEGRFGPIPK